MPHQDDGRPPSPAVLAQSTHSNRFTKTGSPNGPGIASRRPLTAPRARHRTEQHSTPLAVDFTMGCSRKQPLPKKPSPPFCSRADSLAFALITQKPNGLNATARRPHGSDNAGNDHDACCRPQPTTLHDAEETRQRQPDGTAKPNGGMRNKKPSVGGAGTYEGRGSRGKPLDLK